MGLDNSTFGTIPCKVALKFQPVMVFDGLVTRIDDKHLYVQFVDEKQVPQVHPPRNAQVMVQIPKKNSIVVPDLQLIHIEKDHANQFIATLELNTEFMENTEHLQQIKSILESS